MFELPEDVAAETGETAAIDDLASCLPPVLSELSADDRDAITLCDLEGTTQEEYARGKCLSLAGARSRVQRATDPGPARSISAPRDMSPTSFRVDRLPDTLRAWLGAASFGASVRLHVCVGNFCQAHGAPSRARSAKAVQ